jgi:hypothetical protein
MVDNSNKDEGHIGAANDYQVVPYENPDELREAEIERSH